MTDYKDQPWRHKRRQKKTADGQSSSDSDSQGSVKSVPPLAPIARKRGRPPKLHAAASLPLRALEKNRVNLAYAPTVRQQGKSPPTVQPTVPPATPPTGMPSVTNRLVSEAVEKAVAPLAPESSDARRVSTRTTKGKPPIRFGHSG